jgi:hypothetical protein
MPRRPLSRKPRRINTWPKARLQTDAPPSCRSLAYLSGLEPTPATTFSRRHLDEGDTDALSTSELLVGLGSGLELGHASSLSFIGIVMALPRKQEFRTALQAMSFYRQLGRRIAWSQAFERVTAGSARPRRALSR